MLPEQRRWQLLEYVKRHGAANVIELSKNLSVSEATVRRDLIVLERHGEIKRTHGGAVLRRGGTAFEPRYDDKALMHAEAKRAIAVQAARLVNHGDVVILDSGSTTHALALALRDKVGLTIITTDVKIAADLAHLTTIDLITTGGRVRPQLYSLIGHFAEQNLASVHANIAFVGADAISTSSGVTNATLDEVPVKRQAIASADRAILLVDHSKFDKVSLAHVAPLSSFHLCITDAGIGEETLKRYRDANLVITVAKE